LPDGNKFEGDFCEDLKHGQGKFSFADGSYYKGAFSEGMFHGEGEFYFVELSKTYQGNFEQG
jgi:hypothetical protein